MKLVNLRRSQFVISAQKVLITVTDMI